jgi:hypothetical protein
MDLMELKAFDKSVKESEISEESKKLLEIAKSHLVLFLESYPDDLIIENDIEVTFDTINIKLANADEKSVLKCIEKAESVSDDFIIDRFGYKLYPDCISTGVKGIINLINSDNNSILNMTECGSNCINYMLSRCNHGLVFLKTENFYNITAKFGDECNVYYNGYLFSKITRLHRYINNELSGVPRLSDSGIIKFTGGDTSD